MFQGNSTLDFKQMNSLSDIFSLPTLLVLSQHISVYVEAPVTEKEPTAGDASDDAAYQYLRR